MTSTSFVIILRPFQHFGTISGVLASPAYAARASCSVPTLMGRGLGRACRRCARFGAAGSRLTNPPTNPPTHCVVSKLGLQVPPPPLFFGATASSYDTVLEGQAIFVVWRTPNSSNLPISAEHAERAAERRRVYPPPPPLLLLLSLSLSLRHIACCKPSLGGSPPFPLCERVPILLCVVPVCCDGADRDSGASTPPCAVNLCCVL